MGEMQFSKNFNDLSQQHGVASGFQFEFYCERCGDAWRSEFVPFRSGQAAGWIGKAAGFFGGVLGGAGSAVEGLAQAGWGEARDTAFKDAVEQARGRSRGLNPRCDAGAPRPHLKLGECGGADVVGGDATGRAEEARQLERFAACAGAGIEPTSAGLGGDGGEE